MISVTAKMTDRGESRGNGKSVDSSCSWCCRGPDDRMKCGSRWITFPNVRHFRSDLAFWDLLYSGNPFFFIFFRVQQVFCSQFSVAFSKALLKSLPSIFYFIYFFYETVNFLFIIYFGFLFFIFFCFSSRFWHWYYKKNDILWTQII